MALRILIAGGGVGGLCLAQGLRRTGAEVTVFERDPAIAVREQGYRIHIDDNGDAALAHCLPAELYELYLATSNKQSSAVNRLTLREILAHGLDDILHFNATVTGFAEHADRVEVHCADGRTVTGDVLIAADGINSPVRSQFLPGAEPTDTGLRCIYGRTPLSATTVPPRLHNAFTATSDRHGHTLALAVFDPREPISGPFLTPVSGYLMWAVITPAQPLRSRILPSRIFRSRMFRSRILRSGNIRDGIFPDRNTSADPAALHQLALRLIRRMDPELRTLVEHAEPEACLAIPIHTSVPVPPWPTGRVTLLGDAIHAMTPAGGQGANTALRDAALLTDELTAVHEGREELHPALARYEARMREYGFAAVAASLRAVDMVLPTAKQEATR